MSSKTFYFLFLLVTLTAVSCKKKVAEQEVGSIEIEVPIEEKSPMDGLSLLDTKKTYVFSETLRDTVKTKIKEWKTYFEMSTFLKKNYTDVSPSVALEMSEELSELVLAMKDSLQIKVLNNRGVFARLNTFSSEVLRLKDMASISSITPDEVAVQVDKVVAVYNSINSKINSVYAQQNFDENLDFDEAIFNFNAQAEQPYSIPKKKKKIRTSTRRK